MFKFVQYQISQAFVGEESLGYMLQSKHNFEKWRPCEYDFTDQPNNPYKIYPSQDECRKSAVKIVKDMISLKIFGPLSFAFLRKNLGEDIIFSYAGEQS